MNFSTNGTGTIGYPYAKNKLNLELYFIAYKKINLKWIIDLKVNPKNYKTSRKRYGKKITNTLVLAKIS